MKSLLLTLSCFMIFALYSTDVHARPISYPGGWTLTLMNNGHSNSANVHYSPTARTSIGVRSEYRREGDYLLNSIQMNNLLKRWNNKNSQANIYLKSGVGFAYSDEDAFDGEVNAAGFSGIAMDWENRRYFLSYENRYIEAGDIDSRYTQSARVGVAPYVGNYGDLHTWLMLQIEHTPESNEKVTVTPLIRLFKDTHLMEAGFSNQGDVLFNYIRRF